MTTGSVAQSYRSNATAQLLKGFTQLLQGAALPLVVSRFVPAEEFRAWALAWGVALLAGYLDFGLQTGIAGLTARLLASGQPAAARRHAQAAMLVIGVLAACVLAAAVVVAAQVAPLFPALEPSLRHEVRICIPVLVAGQLLNVQAGIVFNYFAGAQRTAAPARLLTSWRLVTLGAIIAGGVAGASVTNLSLLFLAGNLLASAAMARRLRQDLRPGTKHGPVAENLDSLLRAARNVIRSTGALAFWSVAMLCITGLDLVLVGRVDYPDLGAYAIAASLTAGLTGLVNSLQTPMMPRLASHRERRRTMTQLAWMTQLNSVSVLALAAAVILGLGTPLLALVAPHRELNTTAMLIAVLAVAVSLRLLGGPLALGLIAAGASNRVFIPQLIEAAVNLAASISLGVLFGAVGVALGTLIGAVAGLLGLQLGSTARWFGREWVRPLSAALLWEPLAQVGPLMVVAAVSLFGVTWWLTTPLLVAALVWLGRSGHGLVRHPEGVLLKSGRTPPANSQIAGIASEVVS